MDINLEFVGKQDSFENNLISVEASQILKVVEDKIAEKLEEKLVYK